MGGGERDTPSDMEIELVAYMLTTEPLRTRSTRVVSDDEPRVDALSEILVLIRLSLPLFL